MDRKQSADLVVVLQTALESSVNRPALYLGHLHLESSGGGRRDTQVNTMSHFLSRKCLTDRTEPITVGLFKEIVRRVINISELSACAKIFLNFSSFYCCNI